MSRLIVPIDVQALRLRSTGDESADEKLSGPTTAYDDLPWPGNERKRPNVASTILRSLTDDETPDPGIHLHWALPRALTRGVQQRDGSIAFLPAPNRWLVTRLLTHDGAITCAQWIVESDFLMRERDYLDEYNRKTGRASVAVPVGWATDHPPGDEPWRRLGAVFAWRDWAPTAAAPPGAPRAAAHHLDEITSPRPLGPLRAVGHSGPTFAAYYPDCKSAFGFHDRFQDAPIDPAHDAFEVSYHIVGWHGKRDDDPLAAARLAAARRAPDEDDRAVVERCYGWSYAKDVPTPERTLYSGHVIGIPWRRDEAYPTKVDASAATPVRIAVGNSQSEALAALLKDEWTTGSAATGSPGATEAAETDLEIFLDGLQLGLVHRRTEAQPTIALERALHQQGFASSPGGAVWLVRKKGSPSDASVPDDAAEPLLPDERDLARALRALNEAQAELDAHAAVIESMQRQLFLDWYQYTLADARGAASSGPSAADLWTYVFAQLVAIWGLCAKAFGEKASTDGLPLFFRGAIEFDPANDPLPHTDSPPSSLAGAVVARARDLGTKLRARFPQLELQRSNAARFWEPHEPVLVLAGEALTPARRTGDPGPLPCRLSAELIDAVQVQAGEAGAALAASDVIARFRLAKTGLAAETPEGAATLPLLADLAALPAEALLLDPIALPAALAGAPANADPSVAQGAGAAAAVAIRSARNGVPESSATANGARVTWRGTFPAGLALSAEDGPRWTDPFLPLFLAWSIDFRAFARGGEKTAGGDAYDAGYVSDHFGFDENVTDLACRGTPPDVDPPGTALIGATLLSSRIADPLVAALRMYLAQSETPDPDLAALIAHFERKPLLSQGLDGFNDALLTHEIGLQMAPFDPYDFENDPIAYPDDDHPTYRATLTQFVARTVGVQTDRMPSGQVLRHRPLRAGYLDVGSLTVVDAFGRRLALGTDAVVASWRLRPPAGVRHAAFLPPRIAQPARLQFRWLSAEDDAWESDDHPASSPICGWVVPNHLENSLMLFSGAGALVGSVGVVGGGTTVTWQARPGAPWREVDPDLAGANPHLRAFAQRLLGRPAEPFAALMWAIERARPLILPNDKDSAHAQAVLMGWPLALVRAGVRLELQGLPAFDTSPAAIERDSASSGAYDWTKRSCAGLLDVDVPVRIGQLHHIDDGLVAFMREGDPTIYAPASAPASGDGASEARARADDTLNVAAPNDDTVTLKPAPQLGTEARTTLTLLVDPRASVHVSTGLFPVKALEVPPALYAEALRAIEMAFLVNPVVGAPHELTLPVPSEPGFVWEWTPGGGGDVRQPVTPSPFGDRARFGYGPQVVRDGWLRLKPQPDGAAGAGSANAPSTSRGRR